MNEIQKLIDEWRQVLSTETDTRKYRLIMQTIAILESIRELTREGVEK